MASLFHRIKPVCVNVSKYISTQHLNEALIVFKSLQMDDINEEAMLKYIIFPFRLVLAKNDNLHEEQEILCLQCLQTVFSKCSVCVVNDEVILWCLNTFSIYFLSKSLKKKDGGIKESRDKLEEFEALVDISEERKIELTKLVTSALTHVNQKNMLLVYKEKHMPVFGHVISVLLNFIEKERNRELQIVSLNCLKTLSGSSFKDKYFVEVAGKYMASFLPGISMSFHRLLTLKDNLGWNVLVASLKTFSHVIYIVLNDELNSVLLSKEKTLDSYFDAKLHDQMKIGEQEKCESVDSKSLIVSRNTEWLEKTTSQVSIVFRNIFSVNICQTNDKVKLALLEFVERLLVYCMKSLWRSVMDFLDILMNLYCDDNVAVRNLAEQILDKAADIFQSREVSNFSSLLSDRLYNELISLPRVMNSSNEDMKVAKLQIIKGYIKCYGASLKEMLNTQSILERLMMSLTLIMELETDNINIVEERTSIFRQALDIDSNMCDSKFYRKNFKFFQAMTIHKLIIEIIHLIATHGDIELLIDHLVEQGRNQILLRKQSFLIINEIILSCTNISGIDVCSIVESVLVIYLDDQFLKAHVSNEYLESVNVNVLESEEMLITKRDRAGDHHLANAIPFEVLNSNIQMICLILEGISNCAQVLKSDFNNWLIQSLYLILEKVGSTNATISNTAVETLNSIAQFCAYENITDLIFSNSDYLLNSITLQFRRLVYGSAASAVLCVVLRFCDDKFIHLLYDVIEDVIEALNEYQEEVAIEMLTVLKFYNMAADKCCSSCENKHIESCASTPRKKKVKQRELIDISNEEVSIELFVEEYCKLTLQSQGEINESDDFVSKNDLETQEGDGGDDLHETKDETPVLYQIVITSLEKCVTYIASSLPPIRLKALEVVYHGVHALRCRENDLLPLIYKLWPPVIHKLKTEESAIALKSLDVICSMVEYSGDFMTKRITSDFLPYALQFLEYNRNTFTKEKSSFTQIHKVMIKLIHFLGDVIPTVNISKELFCSVCCTIMFYMHCDLHTSIQNAAVMTFRKFYTFKPNVIWLLFQSTCKTYFLRTPQHKIFKAFNFAGQDLHSQQYRDNVLKFQGYLNEGLE